MPTNTAQGWNRGQALLREARSGPAYAELTRQKDRDRETDDARGEVSHGRITRDQANLPDRNNPRLGVAARESLWLSGA